MISVNIKKILILIFINFIMIYVVLNLSWSLISDPGGENVKTFKSDSKIQNSITLPFSKTFLHKGNNEINVNFEPIDTIDVKEPHLFIPFYEGVIKIFKTMMWSRG